MSDEQLKQVIHRIAEQDIGDDMNRWNEIYAQLDLPKNHAVRRLSRWAAMLALFFVGLAVTGLTAYAVFQMAQDMGDDGLHAIQNAGLATEIHESQTIDGVTITLERAYADFARVMVWFTIEGLEIPDGAMQNKFVEPTVLYDDGTPFPLSSGKGMGREVIDGTTYYVLTLSHQEPIPNDSMFHLRLAFDQTDYSVFVPAAGGAAPTEVTLNIPEGFAFDFVLSISAPLTLKPMIQAESAGVTLILRQLEIAPSATLSELCADGNLEKEWLLHMTMQFDGTTATTWGGWGIAMPKADSNGVAQCWDVSFAIPYIEKAETVELTAWFSAEIPQGVQEIPEDGKARLAELGIEGQITPIDNGFSVSVTRKPENMTTDIASALMLNSLAPRREGAWVFRVALPE